MPYCLLELCVLSCCYEMKPTLLHCQAQATACSFQLQCNSHIHSPRWNNMILISKWQTNKRWKVSNSKLSSRNTLGSIFLNTTNLKINQTKKLGPFPLPLFLNTLFLFIKPKSCISLTIDLIASLLHICIQI